MALPGNGTAWPPPHFAPALEQVRRDNAWLSGDMGEIQSQVNDNLNRPYQHRAQLNGGLVGGVARGVLGKPNPDPGGSATIERHLPVAAELVAAFANLLAEKPMGITLHEDDAANARAAESLDEMTGSDMFAAEVWEAMYATSGHGWVFGRVVWDDRVQQHPWIEFVEADQGYTEFLNGRQVATTFWDTHAEREGRKGVWRLLQRHAPGSIEYGLYEGDESSLGRRVPVTDHPETAYLAEKLNADSMVLTGTDRLTARMFRNLERNPTWRHDPQLRYYGRSDVAKAGGLWADIDKGWTNLWHEMDTGRHKLLVSESLLETGAPGQGSTFSMLRDVYRVGDGGLDSAGHIESIQPELRVSEHLAVVDAASRKAIDAVGLSPMTVGMDAQASGQMTATEIRARSDKTMKTFGGKSRQVRAEMSELMTAAVSVDAALNGFPAPARPVNVSIVEPVQDTAEDLANRSLKLAQSESASVWWRVRELHPEWTEQEVDVEVARIKADRAEGQPVDPFAVGEDALIGMEGDE